MDYCSSCRRHLNGALACPGCGAYAPDIAPPAHLYATTGAAATAWDEAPTWHEAGLHEEPAAGAGTGLPAEDVADAPVTTEGRAARRRQRARWKKNQRKAVVATAVALVGGGLTVSAMSQGSNTRAQAATSPDNRSMGVAELPTSDDALPAATSGEAHRSDTGTPATTPASHRRTTDSASAGRSSVHTDSATSPTPTAATGARSQSRSSLSTSVPAGADTNGTSGASGTTTVQTPSSTATDTTTTGTGTSTTTTGSSTDTSTSSGNSTSSGTSQTSGSTSSSSATDPSGLCVLNLLCIN